MKHRAARRIPALLLGALLAACGGDSGTNPDPGPGPSATTGSLALTVQGLPSGTTASIAVAGPGGYAHTAGATETLTELAPGAYSVTVTDVAVDGLVYGPAQSVVYTTVTAGSAAAVTVAYRAFDLSVDDFYITQSIQKYDGSIPLVAGRDGILRVFAKANNANNVKAAVRVRFYQGGILKSTSTIEAPSFAAPTEISEASLGTSWNLKVEGALIQPGLAIAVDIDPAGTIREANESDNQFPSSGAPKALDVRVVPRFDMVLVPVQQGDGSIGNVTAANKNDYVKDLLRMFPIAESHIRVRAPLVTTTTLKGSSVTGDNGSESWETLLEDVELQRVADGATGEYYFGVAKITHDFGIYGIANLSSKVGLGNDYFDGRDLNASMTLAHETGHSMGRSHVSCGPDILYPDPAYPHENGQIGSFGMDVAAERQFGPTTKDLMSYCADRWIGDYTYEKVLDYRLNTESSVGLPQSVAREQTLMVWGRMDDRGMTLEPAFQLDTRPYLPERSGPYRLEGLDANGATVFSISFPGGATDSPNGARVFAYAIPLSVAQPARLAAIRLSGGGRQVVRRAGGGAAGAGLSRAGLRSGPAARGGTQIQWDAASHPLVVLRDPETHEIISLIRGGDATLRLPARPLEAIVSDGVHSVNAGVIAP